MFRKSLEKDPVDLLKRFAVASKLLGDFYIRKVFANTLGEVPLLKCRERCLITNELASVGVAI